MTDTGSQGGRPAIVSSGRGEAKKGIDMGKKDEEWKSSDMSVEICSSALEDLSLADLL